MLVLGTGCATKRDLRDLRAEIQALAERQEESVARLERLTRATQDSVRGQTRGLSEVRGDVFQELRQIQEQLAMLQELTGQNQRMLASLRDRVEGSRRPTFGVPGDSAAPAAPVATEGAEETYQAALTFFNRGSNVTARRAFEQFLQTYPNHERAADATYYLADISAQEDRLQEAIDGFQRIPTLYPTSPRVAEAHYRSGLLYLQMGDRSKAREAFQRVVNSYPDSRVADLARDKLREIR